MTSAWELIHDYRIFDTERREAFFCTCFCWVLAHKRWSLIIVLVLYSVFQTWQAL
ncbi:hypothetical protein ACX1N0_03865 [Acinetobacter sp. ANC 4635]|uniref:hypothetical protein n=1 Tax=Acinetobacter sp. ANC 4635 TaxID=2529846 RepID=UPI0013F14467|nr:hypothetical protein [Acinetobacter sp. ANC 4635]